jgi:molybdopterin-guanine dinucleotide biosynthesis protein A
MIGIILAGGAATRLGGGDKGLRSVGGRSIIERVVAVLRSQCDHLVVNTNGDAGRLSFLELPLVADDLPDRPGPLAGILAGLDWAAARHPGESLALTAPTDAPFLPADLAARLVAARPDGGIACASSGGRTHHTTAVWPVALRHDLRAAVVDGRLRKVGLFLARHRVVTVDWPAEPFDPFFNANTPADLAEADRIAVRFAR